jgi:hypothetical protein
MTSVSPASPLWSNAARMRPISASTIMVKSPYMPAPLLPTNSGEGSHGVCGAVGAK